MRLNKKCVQSKVQIKRWGDWTSKPFGESNQWEMRTFNYYRTCEIDEGQIFPCGGAWHWASMLRW